MRIWLLSAAFLLQTGLLHADRVADPADPMPVDAATTLARIRQTRPDLDVYFQQAYAFAVFPRVIRVGLGFGGAWGRGAMVRNDEWIGEVTQAAITLGLQGGGQAYDQIIFFRNAEALRQFVAEGNLGPLSGRAEFTGRVSAVAVRSGGAIEPGFSSDVAMFSTARGGLMLELTAGPVRYRFTPAQDATSASEKKEVVLQINESIDR